MLIDARSQGCPKPVMLGQEVLGKILEGGTVEVLVDNETSADTIEWFAGKNGFAFIKSQEGSDWRLRIEKSLAPAPAPAESRQEGQLLLIIATDTMGKEEELGRVLMKGFFETMKTYRETPHTIFFLNAGGKTDYYK